MNIRGNTTSNMCNKTFPKLDVYFKRTFFTGPYKNDWNKHVDTMMLLVLI